GKDCNTSPMQPIAPGWTASAGGNVFCDNDSVQAGESVHMSGWNATESGCVPLTAPDTSFACNSDRPVSLCGSTFSVDADWIGQMYISASGLCPTNPTTACANEPNPLAASLCTS